MSSKIALVTVGLVLVLAALWGACREKPAHRDRRSSSSLNAPTATDGEDPERHTAVEAMRPKPESFFVTLLPDTGLNVCDRFIESLICYWKKTWKQTMATYATRQQVHDSFAAIVQESLKNRSAKFRKQWAESCKKKLAILRRMPRFRQCVVE